jgi:hypothetical protein
VDKTWISDQIFANGGRARQWIAGIWALLLLLLFMQLIRASGHGVLIYLEYY